MGVWGNGIKKSKHGGTDRRGKESPALLEAICLIQTCLSQDLQVRTGAEAENTHGLHNELHKPGK